VASCGGNLMVGPTPADGFAVTARRAGDRHRDGSRATRSG